MDVGSRDADGVPGLVSGSCIVDKSNKLLEPAKSPHLYDNWCSSIVHSANCGMNTRVSCKGTVWRHREDTGSLQ